MPEENKSIRGGLREIYDVLTELDKNIEALQDLSVKGWAGLVTVTDATIDADMSR